MRHDPIMERQAGAPLICVNRAGTRGNWDVPNFPLRGTAYRHAGNWVRPNYAAAIAGIGASTARPAITVFQVFHAITAMPARYMRPPVRRIA
jgi:hypothetical protein